LKRYLAPTLAGLFILSVVFAQSYRVGPVQNADSINMTPRAGRSGETIVQASGGSNKERVRRGSCYWAAAGSNSFAPGTVIGTTAFMCVYNPQNSGNLVIIRKVYAVYNQGTLGTGIMFHCINPTATQTAPLAGTLMTNTPALAGANNASVAQCRGGATVVAPTIIAPFQYLAPELATTVTQPQFGWEDLDDGIALLPGTSYQLQTVGAAGTGAAMSPAVFWEEQPLLNGQP
jgi:hypothetical protein